MWTLPKQFSATLRHSCALCTLQVPLNICSYARMPKGITARKGNVEMLELLLDKAPSKSERQALLSTGVNQEATRTHRSRNIFCLLLKLLLTVPNLNCLHDLQCCKLLVAQGE